MKRALIVSAVFIIGLAAVVTKVGSGQAAAGAKPVDQVAQLERDWLAADGKGDVTTLRRIVADDFIGQFDGRPVLTKEDIIPRDGYRGEFAGATPAGTYVRVFGDTAVLMGSIKATDINQASGIRVTLVCQKRAQGWQMIAAHLVHTAEKQKKDRPSAD